MIAGRLEDITENEIAQLCRSETAEGRMLEFKRELPGDGREEKAEFLADATSLANGQGGDLIFGIEDKDGVAVSMPGVQPTNLDQTILRLENLLRTSADRLQQANPAAVWRQSKRNWRAWDLRSLEVQ